MTSRILLLSGKKLLSVKENSLLELSGYFDLGIDFCQKFQSYRKVLQTKVVQNLLSYKKLTGFISLSPAKVEQGGSKYLLLFK